MIIFVIVHDPSFNNDVKVIGRALLTLEQLLDSEFLFDLCDIRLVNDVSSVCGK